MRGRRRSGEGAEEAALRLVQEHAAELLRFARRFSHCADDAHDAYQRTLEILVRRLRTDPPDRPLQWVRTVLRHEALALRRERDRLVAREDVDLDRHEGDRLGDPAERAVGHERLRHTAEALARLKPQELTALVLRAEGLSYREICTRTGWTYTRTNRAVTEGRRALLQRIGAIESGAECARWLPSLSALADGEATRAQIAELRPHLRACPSCRATLREFHAAPARVAALVPAALLPFASPAGGALTSHVAIAVHGFVERATLLAARTQAAFETLPGAKLAAVAASTAAIAGGGAVIEQAAGSASHAARSVVPAVAVAGPRLDSIALPVAGAPAVGARRAGRRSAPHGEFASAPTAASEFTPRAPAAAEFAAATASPSPRADAATASPAAAGSPSPPSEFGGP
jgi:RNA polymerase sigma factor (sigma-70 family)